MATTPKLGAPRSGDPVIIKPSWQSTMPDTGDPTKLGPDAWNTERFVTGGNPGDVLMRDSASSTGASWGTLPTLVSPAEVAAGDAATLTSANTYAEECEAAALADAKAYADAQDGTTLAAANSHADSGDAATLASAKAYVDAKPKSVIKHAFLATPILLPTSTPVNTDTTLWSWTLPATQLAHDGDVFQVRAWGQFLAVNAGSRTITFALGSVTIGTLTYSGSQASPWVFQGMFVRASQAAQSLICVVDGDPSLVATVALPTLDLGQPQPLTLKARQGGTPASPSLQIAGVLVTQW